MNFSVKKLFRKFNIPGNGKRFLSPIEIGWKLAGNNNGEKAANSSDLKFSMQLGSE